MSVSTELLSIVLTAVEENRTKKNNDRHEQSITKKTATADPLSTYFLIDILVFLQFNFNHKCLLNKGSNKLSSLSVQDVFLPKTT